MVISKKILTLVLVVLVLAAAGYLIGVKKIFQPKTNQQVAGKAGAPGKAPPSGTNPAAGAPDQKAEAARRFRSRSRPLSAAIWSCRSNLRAKLLPSGKSP